MSNPFVSVVIPSYNAAKWLPDTIESVRSQGYRGKDLEIIVIDDCSTDNTQYLIEFMNHDAQCPIRYFKNNINLGECKSSRRGFEHANGEWICRLSADDLWVPRKLGKQLLVMEITNADFSYFTSNYVGTSLDNAKIVESHWISIPSRYSYKLNVIFGLFDNIILRFPRLVFMIMIIRGNPINSSTLMFKKSSYMKIGGWTEEYRTDCDGMLLFRSLLSGLKGKAINEPVASLYRVHDGQTTNNPLYSKEMKLIRNKMIDESLGKNQPLWFRSIMKVIKKFKYNNI
jgi:glycosyltransferase involved in cell wall biosynthesis